MSTKRCPACNLIMGSQVEAGEFCSNTRLAREGILQLCAGCLKNIPPGIIAIARTDPNIFIQNKRMKLKYKNDGNWLERADFGDRKMVVNVNPGIDIQRVR